MEILYSNYIKKIITNNNNTNVFLTNILIINSKQKNPVDWHYDATLNIKIDNKYLLPFLINIFYVSVPQNMKKGYFEFQEYGSDNKKQYNILDSNFIYPKNNMLCMVRGDVFHRVHQFKGIGKRISLITEEYIIPKNYLKNIPEFKII